MSGSSPSGLLPNLVVIGARKGGTTSLHYYLGLHPEISMSARKELDFFIRRGNWSRGGAWYRSHFPTASPIRGESSPNYCDHHLDAEVPRRMHDLLPDAKLIYLVRDPIARILSEYTHDVADGREHRALADALREEGPNKYLRRCRYSACVERFLAVYPRSHVLIATTEALLRRRDETLRRIFRFLGVDPTFSTRKFKLRWNLSRYKRRAVGRDRSALRESVWRLARLVPFEARGVLEKLAYLPVSRRVTKPALDGELREEVNRALASDIRRLRDRHGIDCEGWSV